MFPDGFYPHGQHLFKWVGVVQKCGIKTLFSDGEIPSNTLNNLIHFCYPTENPIAGPITFTFRFMSTDEKFYNAFCLLDQSFVQIKELDSNQQTVICFISSYYHVDVFEEALKIVRNLLLNNLPSAIQFIHTLYEDPDSITFMKSLKTLWKSSRSDEIYNNQVLYPIVKKFDATTIAYLVFHLLLDTPIIATSSDLNELSQFCYSLTSIIHPLKWHHIFVPVLPKSIIETVLSPSPFIVGIHSSMVENLPNSDIEAHLFIDIDNASINRVNLTNLPQWVHQIASNVTKITPKSLHQLMLEDICTAIGMHPSGSPYLIARKILAATKDQKLNSDSITSQLINSRTVKCLLNTIKESPIPNTYMTMLSSFTHTFVSFPASQNVEEFPLKKALVPKSSSVQFPQKKRSPHKSKSLSEIPGR